MTDDFSEVFSRLDDQAARAERGDFATRTLPQPDVSGASRDELVRVHLSGGRATAAEVDARAMRLTNAELGDLVVEAVNAAIEANNAAIMAAMQDNQTDFGALREKLANIGAQAQRSMEQYAAGMQDSLAQARAASEAAAGLRKDDA